MTPGRGALRRAAAAFREEDPADLGPARTRALKLVPSHAYYAALGALRREDWDEFLRRIPRSRRRSALRALRDVLDDRQIARLARLAPPPRGKPARRRAS